MLGLMQDFPLIPVSGDDISLIHGDYRLDNVIYHPSEPRVMSDNLFDLSGKVALVTGARQLHQRGVHNRGRRSYRHPSVITNTTK